MIYLIEHYESDVRQRTHKILYATTDKEKALEYYNSKKVQNYPDPLHIEYYILTERDGVYFNVIEIKTNYEKK